MTRIENVGGGASGSPRRGQGTKRSHRSGGSGKSRGSGGTRRSHRVGGRSSTAAGAKGEAATTASASSGARGVSTSASVWPHAAPHTGAEGTAALELAVAATGADVGLLDALLELLRTEHLTLGHALAAWQREQDRLANRAWR